MRVAKGLLVFALAALLTAAAQTQPQRPTPHPTPQSSPRPNQPPSVKLVPSVGQVTLAGCGEDTAADPLCPATSPQVKLSAQAADPDGDPLFYTYTTEGGRVLGAGSEVTLDLTGVAPGVYRVTVEVKDGVGAISTDATEVTVVRCTCDPPPTPPLCPTVTVNCPDVSGSDRRLVFTANVSGGDPNVTPTYNWKVSAGRVVSGLGTRSITLEIPEPYGAYTGVVEVGGYDRSCQTSTSCSFLIEPPIQPRLIDEYGDIRFGVEQQRLDNIAVELQNDPTSQAYLICYGGRRSEPRLTLRRCGRAKNYLVSGRGVAAKRIVTLAGGRREEPTVEVWIVPFGGTTPRPSPTFFPRGRR